LTACAADGDKSHGNFFSSLAKYWADADLITEITKIALGVHARKKHICSCGAEAAAGANAVRARAGSY